MKEHLETDITKMLHELGIPAHIKGYQYLRDAIAMSVEDQEMMSSVTKILYPAIAKRKPDNGQPGGTSYTSCHRGGLGQRQDGNHR